jgi:hypothetical protein
MKLRPVVLSVLLPLGIIACSAPTYTYGRAGATQADVSRDTFDCLKEVKAMHSNDLVFGPIWYVAAANSKADRQRTKLMNLCMEGRGYSTLEER